MRNDASHKMEGHHPDTHDPITVIRFLESFCQTCITNGFHEGSAIWILPHYIQKRTGTALTAQLRVTEEQDGSFECMLTSYPVVINNLLRTYVTEDTVAEADAALRHYIGRRTQAKLSIVSKRGRKHELIDRKFLTGLQAEVDFAHVRDSSSHALHKRPTDDDPIATTLSVPPVSINHHRCYGSCNGNPFLRVHLEFFEATDRYTKTYVRGAWPGSTRNISPHRAR